MDKVAMYLLAAICFTSGGVLGYKEISGWGLPFFVGVLLALAAHGTKLIDIKA